MQLADCLVKCADECWATREVKEVLPRLKEAVARTTPADVHRDTCAARPPARARPRPARASPARPTRPARRFRLRIHHRRPRLSIHLLAESVLALPRDA